jgi:hypothetical protein
LSLESEVESLRLTVSEHQDFVDKLRYLPKDSALELLQQLRAGADPAKLIQDLEGNIDVHPGPSGLNTAQVVIPPTNSPLESELMARNYCLYPRKKPIDINSFVLSPVGDQIFKGQLDNDLLSHQSFDTSFQVSQPFLGGQDKNFSSQGSSNTTCNDDVEVDFQSEHQLYCDPRLYYLQTSKWVRTPINDNHAASAMSRHLSTDHPVLGHFDADLFLTDLVEGRPRFCSPFLVGAFLCLTCVCSPCFV